MIAGVGEKRCAFSQATQSWASGPNVAPKHMVTQVPKALDLDATLE